MITLLIYLTWKMSFPLWEIVRLFASESFPLMFKFFFHLSIMHVRVSLNRWLERQFFYRGIWYSCLWVNFIMRILCSEWRRTPETQSTPSGKLFCLMKSENFDKLDWVTMTSSSIIVPSYLAIVSIVLAVRIGCWGSFFLSWTKHVWNNQC